MKVVWSDPALQDVELVYDYLLPLNPVAAVRVIEDLVLAGDGLSVFPYRGRSGRSQGTRELAIVRPYVIVYEIADEEVIILRVWHGAQDRPS